MGGNGEAEDGRLDRCDLVEGRAAVDRSEDPVMVLAPDGIRLGRAMRQPVRVLDIEIERLVRRHVFGAQATTHLPPAPAGVVALDRKSTRLNSSHSCASRM